jgi:hypothetical protein
VDELNWNFSLAVPERWYVRDDDPCRREASTAQDVEERIAGRPDLARAVPMLLRIRMESWRDAELSGALAAATLWEPSDDRRGATAATLVVVTAARLQPDDDDGEIAGLLELLGEGSEADLAPRLVAAVDLPAGRAVRLRRLTRTDGAEPGQAELVVDMVQHWVPVPGGRAVLVLVGSTPCLDVADELAATFDAIAETLVFDSSRP